MPTRSPTIAQTALLLIRERGPLPIDDLVQPIVDAGRTTAKDPSAAVERAIANDPKLLRGWDDRWYSTFDQLDGAIFTVRPTDLERREGIVLVRDELSLVASLVPKRGWSLREPPYVDSFRHRFDLPSWGFDILDFDEDDWPIRDPARTIRAWVGNERADELLRFAEDVGIPRDGDDETALRRLVDGMAGMDVIQGPTKWIPDLDPDQLLGLAIDDGVVRAIAVDARRISEAHVEAAAKRITALSRRVIGPDESWFGPPSIPIETLVAMIVTAEPGLLRRPLPPIGDVISRGGLVLDDGRIHHPGTPMAA